MESMHWRLPLGDDWNGILPSHAAFSRAQDSFGKHVTSCQTRVSIYNATSTHTCRPLPKSSQGSRIFHRNRRPDCCYIARMVVL